MNKNETIFFAIVIIAYILCAFTLDIPSYVHIIFAIGLLAILSISIALRLKPNLENEKAGKILKVILILVLIFYVLAMISELWFGKAFFIDSGILLFALIVLIVIYWFFKK